MKISEFIHKLSKLHNEEKITRLMLHATYDKDFAMAKVISSWQDPEEVRKQVIADIVKKAVAIAGNEKCVIYLNSEILPKEMAPESDKIVQKLLFSDKHLEVYYNAALKYPDYLIIIASEFSGKLIIGGQCVILL